MQTHVTIPVDDEFLTGELFTPPGDANALMLFCHGWTSSNKKYLHYAEELSRKGILTLAINLRGHGDSPYSIENYSRTDHLNDLLTSIDYIKNVNPTVPLVLMGKSYGGYLSSIASTRRTVDFLIISQPALYPDAEFDSPNAALIKKNPGIFRSVTEIPENNRALKAISEFRNPLLIIESQHDEEVSAVPKLYIQASEQNINRTTLIIPNADHPLSRPEWLEDYYNKVISWLRDQKVFE